MVPYYSNSTTSDHYRCTCGCTGCPNACTSYSNYSSHYSYYIPIKEEDIKVKPYFKFINNNLLSINTSFVCIENCSIKNIKSAHRIIFSNKIYSSKIKRVKKDRKLTILGKQK